VVMYEKHFSCNWLIAALYSMDLLGNIRPIAVVLVSSHMQSLK
jgi:hypothetical protein